MTEKTRELLTDIIDLILHREDIFEDVMEMTEQEERDLIFDLRIAEKELEQN